MAEVKTVKQLIRTALMAEGFWTIEADKCPKWAKSTVAAFPEAFILKGNSSVKELEPLKTILKEANLPSFGTKDCSDEFYGTRGLVVIPKATWQKWEVEPSQALTEYMLQKQDEAEASVDF